MSDLLSIDFARLRADVEALAAIGRSADHGIYRMAFSDGDMAGRDWLRQRIEAAGLDFHQDGGANLHGRLNGQAPISIPSPVQAISMARWACCAGWRRYAA
jgi:N-carbamoyl-L-amino-acid hydrolase